MNDKTEPVTALHQVDQGGAYEMRDGVIVRVEEPTHPGDSLGSAKGADGGPGAAVGTASGEPPRPPEASAGAASPLVKRTRAG